MICTAEVCPRKALLAGPPGNCTTPPVAILLEAITAEIIHNLSSHVSARDVRVIDDQQLRSLRPGLVARNNATSKVAHNMSNLERHKQNSNKSDERNGVIQRIELISFYGVAKPQVGRQ